MPPGGRGADLAHFQLIRRFVDECEERTHGDDPRQVEAAQLDTDAHLTHGNQSVTSTSDQDH